MNRVLVVVDMQKDFIDGALGTGEAQAIVENVRNKIREFDGIVVATRDTHGEAYLDTREGRNLPIKHCIKGSEGWEIEPEIGALLSEKGARIFDKPTFGSKKLAEYLAELEEREKIREIELVGLCTDICVISNALVLKAFLPETEISVDSSCLAGVTPESHENALLAMKMCQITIK